MTTPKAFVDEIVKLCAPKEVVWCTGTKEEYKALCKKLVESKTFQPLSEKLWPNSFVCRTSPDDVSRNEEHVFICSKSKDSVGPTGNWEAPEEMKKKTNASFSGSMKGRTAYVVPFSMCPVGSPIVRYGIEVTDSPYVVLHMHITNSIGTSVLEAINAGAKFFPCVHSLGAPLEDGAVDDPWPHNPANKFLAYFPEDGTIWSYGSGYGGVSLLGSKWLGLQVATHDILSNNEPWIAQHGAIVSVTSPKQETTYVLAVLPSGCGKSTLAFQVPKLAGWSVRTVSDNIAWLSVEDGKLYGNNPEVGFVGIAPGTSYTTTPSVMAALKTGNSIFTNVAVTADGDVWWEGKTKVAPESLTDWTGKPWTPASSTPAAHPNSRFAVPAVQCPTMDKNWQSRVPIDAILFGTRRSSGLDPLIREAFDWNHGVFLGACLTSETTSTQEGPTGVLRRDSFAMKVFCGGNMASYWAHWSKIGAQLSKQPKIFLANFFQKGSNGAYLWPGYGDNARVLKWVIDRTNGNPATALAQQTFLGYVPLPSHINTLGMDIAPATVEKLLAVEHWTDEVKELHKYLEGFGSATPSFIMDHVTTMEHRFAVGHNTPATTNKYLLQWVAEYAALFEPDSIFWVDGSEEEYNLLCGELVKAGTFTRLNDKLRPNSYLARSTVDDVARVEERTYICAPTKEEVGPTNNWMAPEDMKKILTGLYKGSMKGRTMYVIPFCMGPLGSPLSKYGVQLTDSAYVVVNNYIMTRMGSRALSYITGKDFVQCLHSVGSPLAPGQKDVPWPCSTTKYITHFPYENLIMSYGSGYGGNALLGKKCLALRIGSFLAQKEGWMAEHCLIMSLTSPEGKKYYIAAGFPSACGKTNLAMLVPTIPGWSVQTIGDDIAWMRPGPDGRLYAINPENGFFGVAPGTSELSNQSALEAMSRNSIFTNVALTPEGDVWWEDKTPKQNTPQKLTDWTGKEWTPDCGRKAAHPNSRYTVPCSQNPVLDPDWEKISGVPIDAILFGGRRPSLIPLVTESFDWAHGVFQGSLCSSETTAAAAGAVGVVRRDPFAMLPFCGYNMAKYWGHWLDMGKTLGDKAPKIFYVNWFRKGDGKFLWPGFGDNSRVLKWICSRVDGTGAAHPTPLGLCPPPDAIDTSGLDITEETMKILTSVDTTSSAEEWKKEVKDCKDYYAKFGNDIPEELSAQLQAWVDRLGVQ